MLFCDTDIAKFEVLFKLINILLLAFSHGSLVSGSKMVALVMLRILGMDNSLVFCYIL